jgi:hypothetical protein
MTGSVFLDTNVVIALFADEGEVVRRIATADEAVLSLIMTYGSPR